LLIGIALYAMVSFGLLPKLFITEYGIQIGSAVEIILLSFALAYRNASMRIESDVMARTSRDRLKTVAAEQSVELRRTLDQLAEANKQLALMRQTDALTGLSNRSHFRSAFNEIALSVKLKQQKLGVLILTLDQFEQIDNRHGQSFGEICLRSVAKILSDIVNHDTSIIARLDGADFGILISDINESSLINIAERICQTIRNTPVQCGDTSIPITTSIGYLLLDDKERLSNDEVLRRAELALVAAKAGGHDQIHGFITNTANI